MKTLSFLFAVFLIITTSLQSCSGDTYNENLFKPKSHGDPGIVLVVLDRKYWGSALEDSIKKHFQQKITTLPQPEDIFTLEITSRKGFTQAKKTQHTIVIFDIGNKANNRNARLDKPAYDIWAKGQVMYKFRASSQKSAIALFSLEVDNLIDALNESSRKKLRDEYEFSSSSTVVNELSKVQKLTLSVPKDIKVSENQEGFAWLKRSRSKWANNQEHEIQQGILIYSYPYTDDSTFTIDYQIAKRDSVFKYAVPGPAEGSYMATETRFGVTPEYTEKMNDKTYIFEMRGLWRVEGDLMGGPFVSISIFDEPNNRIVTIEGYVYAPHFEKREFLRELETMIYSYQFLE